jgi:hypothetical protein
VEKIRIHRRALELNVKASRMMRKMVWSSIRDITKRGKSWEEVEKKTMEERGDCKHVVHMPI